MLETVLSETVVDPSPKIIPLWATTQEKKHGKTRDMGWKRTKNKEEILEPKQQKTKRQGLEGHGKLAITHAGTALLKVQCLVGSRPLVTSIYLLSCLCCHCWECVNHAVPEGHPLEGAQHSPRFPAQTAQRSKIITLAWKKNIPPRTKKKHFCLKCHF